ncbi:P-loop containing nucleoside triphosphate hydrolase protein [Ochromonadaceae sp. CCMP2298]|nr:P-loop containing nucleoside triphosphate hydrolase protein [Ochromonadaceae sp. CCMP2298]|mmetsp:Transcript_4406/g.9915  ORF Transcript_4406/g.9915 Transcript_4406/m.9915 type:complete len:1398 (+) Transcript_4406:231-4424(+)
MSFTLSFRSDNGEPRALEDEANIISQIFLLYLNPLFKKGADQSLEMPDLGPTSWQDKTKRLFDAFTPQLEKESQRSFEKRSLWYVLWRTVGYFKLCLALGLYAGYSVCSFIPILILDALVQHFQGTTTLTTWQLWTLAALMFVVPMLGTVLAAHSNLVLAHCGLQFRNALIAAIYRKALRLSPSARQKSSTGQIVNMFSNDTAQLQRFLLFLNNLFLAPVVIGVAIFLIYLQVGASVFVGLGLIIIVLPMNGVIFDWLSKVRKRKVEYTDRRVKLMNEILNGIRIIKYYAWEAAFKERVEDVRETELELLRLSAYIVAVAFSMVLMAVPVFLPVLIFFTYVKLGGQLDAAKIFTTIALFNLMQFPFIFLPLGLTQYNQTRVSTQRILEFLAAEELSEYVDPMPAEGLAVEMKNVSMGWVEVSEEEKLAEHAKEGAYSAVANDDSTAARIASAPSPNSSSISSSASASTSEKRSVVKETELRSILKQGKAELAGEKVEEESKGTDAAYDINQDRSVNTLRDLSFSIKKGELVAVVGSVGSGKSSLLNGLLGEMLLQKGSVAVQGSIAYCDQRPWIINDTVQANIVFGLPFDEERFDNALFAANLEDDILVLPGGINTQIGERGINLSGGQKARVALARAIYRDADIYLLDDPLSAVDAHVGQFLFHEGLRRALKGKTRILVTHQTHLLPDCDKIVVLDNGKVRGVGTYEELQQRGINVEDLLYQQANAGPEAEAFAEICEVATTADSAPASAPVSSTNTSIDGAHLQLKEKSMRQATARKADTRATTINSKEERSQGDVTTEIYSYYLRAGGAFLFSVLLLCVAISQVFTLLASFWLAEWGQTARDREEEDRALSTSRNVWYLNIFAALSCGTLLFYLIRSIILANHRMVASRVLHEGLLKVTLFAPVAFFDVTPTGRVLNRFSSDLQKIDEEIAQSMSQGLNSLANVLGAVGAVAGATKGTFLVLVPPVAFFYRSVQKYFTGTNTAVSRLEAISRSPIYADFSQALSGMTTIRAYADSERFINGLEDGVDSNSVANMTQQAASQWLAIRLDLIGASISFFIAVLAVAVPGFIPPGSLGLALSYSFQLTSYLKFLVRMVATIESQMNAVERVKYYMDNIEEEGSDKVSLPDGDIPEDWPSKGVVTAVGLQMRYRDGPLVLKGVDFNVKGGEKVGLAGRTGSGKSSLMVGLFRIQELAEGSIFIDGLDTSKIPLRLLRSKLGIIPQEPVMFSASVRFNLDPFSEHSDAKIWEVLSSINMKEHILTMPGKLSEEVAEGGSNFSAGQRQLVCIARALLRNPKILILDEATASIDNETDALVQRMVKEQFKNCTVLTIAHRLNTIIDSDKIMVMDDGLLGEYDSPKRLLGEDASPSEDAGVIPSKGLFKALWEKHLESHGQD